MLILKYLKHDHHFISIHLILTYLSWAWIYDINGKILNLSDYFSVSKFQEKKKNHLNTKNLNK